MDELSFPSFFFHGLKGLTETERDAEGVVGRDKEKEGRKKNTKRSERNRPHNSERDLKGIRESNKTQRVEHER